MPYRETTGLDLLKNRVDDHLHNPYKHEHGKIDCKDMLIKKFQKVSHEDSFKRDE